MSEMKKSKSKKKAAVFISGSGTNMVALQKKILDGGLSAEIVLVLSDRDGIRGLERAKEFGIPTAVVDYKEYARMVKELGDDCPLPPDFNLMKTMSEARSFTLKRWSKPEDREKAERFFKTRALAEQEIWKIIEPLGVDYILLAGFMQILTPYFQDKFQPDHENPRIINIHPALLPSFPGEHGYEDTYNYGCAFGGATVHFVDCGEDTGPIIGQGVFPREQWMTLDDFKARGLQLEYELYWQCVQKVIDGEAGIIISDSGRRTVENPLSIIGEKIDCHPTLS